MVLNNLYVMVAELSGEHVLQNADGGPGGVGSMITIGQLAPGESVDVPFILCLKPFGPFTFFVDIYGLPK